MRPGGSKALTTHPHRWAVVADTMNRGFVAVLAAVLVAGCGQATLQTSEDAGAHDAGRPSDLIGSWTVSGTGEEPGMVLGLGSRLTLVRGCGKVDGQWEAGTHGGFLALATGGGQMCPFSPKVGSLPSWLARATSFRLDGDRRELLDSHDAVVARLAPTGADDPDAESMTTAERARLDIPPAPLPAGLRPATSADLLGRWVSSKPDAAYPDAPLNLAHLELQAENRWIGFDGCSAMGGRWLSPAAGTLLGTILDGTLGGCTSALGGWFASARLAGFDGDELVLLSRSGQEYARLKRPPP